jgi:phosphoribosylamine---glycine ligase
MLTRQHLKPSQHLPMSLSAQKPHKVLVIGSGGREHALAWKLRQSPHVAQIFVAPGNGGTALEADLHNLALTDIHALADWAATEKMGLTVVGPEAPLAAGIVDVFRARGLRIFGPTQAAAQLESSKAFAKDFMQRHGIPTAHYQTFSDAEKAHRYVSERGAPIVIKADGLAAGKGVVVATTVAQAHEAIDGMLLDNKLGVTHNAGGARVVIEDFLEGEEASFMVVSDGQAVLALATSQDHKRLLDGDAGPNTGGMGAYSPAPVVTPEVHERVMRQIIHPTIAAMAADGMPFTGFLYAGLMIDAQGTPRTVEFNCRLGDPETQPILMRLQSDLFELLMAATDARLSEASLQWDSRVALGVVLAAEGYPLNPRKGDVITGIPADQADAKVFHAGTVQANGQLRTSGGRVLCVTALGETVQKAREVSHQQLQKIHFDGMQYRRDIGHRALGTDAKHPQRR